MIITVLLCLVFVTVSFACIPTYVCVWTLCCVVLTWLCLLLLPHFLADAFFVLHSTSDAFFMPVLYPVLSAITKINNKPASFLLFGLEDNYDPELLNSISFETKRKKKKNCVLILKRQQSRKQSSHFDKGPTSGLANKAIYINKSETFMYKYKAVFNHSNEQNQDNFIKFVLIQQCSLASTSTPAGHKTVMASNS